MRLTCRRCSGSSEPGNADAHDRNVGHACLMAYAAMIRLIATPSRAAALFTAALATSTAGVAASLAILAVSWAAAAADLAPTDDIRDIRGPKGILPAWLIPAILAAA